MNGFLVNPDAMSIALHTCVFLSLQPQGPYYSTQSVSDYFGFSVHHVAKVVQKLARAGILDTVRGGKGGIRLKKAPLDIFVYDIYRVIEGNYQGKYCGACLIRVRDCNGHDCVIGKWMKKMHDETIEMFKRLNLPTLIGSIERLQIDQMEGK